MTDVQENHGHTSWVDLIALDDLFFNLRLRFQMWMCLKHQLFKTLRGYSNDNGMTFILDRVHSISIYFSAFVCMIPKDHFVPVQVILVFIPNKIVVLVQILVSCKLKTNFVLDLKSQIV